MWRICIETETKHFWKPDPPKTWLGRLFDSIDYEARAKVLAENPEGRHIYCEPEQFDSRDMALLAMEVARDRLRETYCDTYWAPEDTSWSVLARERVVRTYVEEII